VPVQLTILGSGSGGNCAYLEAGDTRLLIDAGLSARQIRQRLLSIGRSHENLTGILVTHEHSDHCQALGTLAAKQRIPVFCNRLTRDAIESSSPNGCDYHVFETGTTFDLGETEIETFSIPHDASDPVGFLIRAPAGQVGFLTDLGHATRLALQRVRSAHVLVLEANHDVQMLQDNPHRPWSLKQRILSRHGHLSNEAAADALQEVVSSDLKHLVLAHLSRDCNRPDLALGAVHSRLDQLGVKHLRVEAASQHTPTSTMRLG
jgi:phosphoribosyl 1,2-cyclic phosphodiesterase